MSTQRQHKGPNPYLTLCGHGHKESLPVSENRTQLTVLLQAYWNIVSLTRWIQSDNYFISIRKKKATLYIDCVWWAWRLIRNTIFQKSILLCCCLTVVGAVCWWLFWSSSSSHNTSTWFYLLNKSFDFCFSEITCFSPNLDSSLCLRCLARFFGLAVLLCATRGRRGPAESLHRAAWVLGLTETVHQTPLMHLCKAKWNKLIVHYH